MCLRTVGDDDVFKESRALLDTRIGTPNASQGLPRSLRLLSSGKTKFLNQLSFIRDERHSTLDTQG